MLMHERPVLGGNASSEMRVHICGADRHNGLPNMRETGILEELRLENLRRNPLQNFSIWDTILYEKAHFQPGLQMLLNCTCQQAEMDGSRIVSVTGWQLTTETQHTVYARQFIDCSGDAILAPLTGAECRMGREARSEYGESIAPEVADTHTMGMTCLFQTREYATPQPFEPPAWANSYPSEEELPYGAGGHDWWQMGYWWVELGGDRHSIFDTEILRDELLKIAFGVWDHIKNHGDHGAENWALEWMQFLPAKRESRRYLGDHVLAQRDVEAGGHFADLVAYGGWTMDDHHPSGFHSAVLGHDATIFHHAPSPYGIPYRALYSRNIDNLGFAGRCASCTHAAMSSTRVMGTAAVMGQAIGTAAALAVQDGLSLREVGQQRLPELQQALLRDDCYLPWHPQQYGELTARAALSASRGDAEPLRDGFTRPIDGEIHRWPCAPGDWAAYHFAQPAMVNEVTLVLDSALDQLIAMSIHDSSNNYALKTVPDKMAKSFRLEGLVNGEWQLLHEVSGNYQRLVRLPVQRQLGGVRFVLGETWGAPETNLYAFIID